MKELFLALLLSLPHAAKTKHSEARRPPPAPSKITVTISENIEIKDDKKTKKIEVKKKVNVPFRKIETKDADGNKVIIYVPEV